MPNLNSIIDVQITRETKTPTQKGFGTLLILGTNAVFAEKLRAYSDLEEVLSDFTTADEEYKFAAKAFGQDIKPEVVKIGKRLADVAQISNVNPTTIANSTLYRVTLNGVNCDYTSDGTATGPEIQAGLIAAINGSSQASVLTAAAGSGNSVDITSDTAGLGFSISASANIAVTTPTANVNAATTLADIQEVDDDFYCVALTSRAQKDILDVAAYIEGQFKIFAACSSEAGVLTTGTTDSAYLLSQQTYDRTFFLYSGDQANGPEAGWVGGQLPKDPGSITWKFKTIKGIAADALTTTQATNARNKKANVYIPMAGINMTQEGVMASGEFIDIIQGADFITARLQETIYQRLVNVDKIPFTNAGIDIIVNLMRQVLQIAVDDNKILSDFTITKPDVADISDLDKGARFLDNLEFEGTLQGAVHKMKIRGRLVL